MKKIRCAIYTRKSSEEGLEQDFNSLHAQREACSAYILSQASEGWSLLDDDYGDGGLSGGTLERPALQRLLNDIDAGKIDIVVVYKVDRLNDSWMSRVIRLNFLAPDLVTAVLSGQHSTKLNVAALTSGGSIPMRWDDQVTFFS